MRATSLLGRTPPGDVFSKQAITQEQTRQPGRVDTWGPLADPHDPSVSLRMEIQHSKEQRYK